MTFLFTDIEGSTELWEHDPASMQRAFSRQEAIVRESDLQWSLVQPVGLNDGDAPEERIVTTDGDLQKMAVSRKTVATLIADTLETDAYDNRSVAISAA